MGTGAREAPSHSLAVPVASALASPALVVAERIFAEKSSCDGHGTSDALSLLELGDDDNETAGREDR